MKNSTRRTFLRQASSLSIATGLSLELAACTNENRTSFDQLDEQVNGVLARLSPDSNIGQIEVQSTPSALKGGTWYLAHQKGDGLQYNVTAELFREARFLVLDLLHDGDIMGKHAFHLRIFERDNPDYFFVTYAVIPQMQGRLRLDLNSINLNTLWLGREAALIKPAARGSRIDHRNVNRIEIRCQRIGHPISPVRWCQTALYLLDQEPPKIDKAWLPQGKLVDRMGQSTLLKWPGKVSSVQQLNERLKRQSAAVEQHQWPDQYSRWGGDANRKIEGTGYFRTHYGSGRWWLVDPEGHLFWSSGMDCVDYPPSSPLPGMRQAYKWLPQENGKYSEAYDTHHRTGAKSINFLRLNMIRSFGKDWHQHFKGIAIGELRRAGFNTIANWSQWESLRHSGIPYVIQTSFDFEKTPTIYRTFRDVYDPLFADEASAQARQLESTKDDPGLIGYFLENEAEWSFSSESPAEGMLFNTESCHTRNALAQFLERRYDSSNQTLSDRWNMEVDFEKIRSGVWEGTLTPVAREDLVDFSGQMVDRFYRIISEACRAVDPNHLNLGSRFPGLPRNWVYPSMRHVDVFSVNVYRNEPGESLCEVSEELGKPIMIGEWHFGSIVSGLPGLANRQVMDQRERGKAFRVYQEKAASMPCIVGSHYFRFYDNPAMGRFDGENYNIGFMDITNQPYEPMVEAAQLVHRNLYAIAAGDKLPSRDIPRYLGL